MVLQLGQPSGQALEQRRNLVTPIPGPRSLELAQRRSAAVASGVSSIMPVFVYQSFEAQGVSSFAPFSSAPTKLSNNGANTATG